MKLSDRILLGIPQIYINLDRALATWEISIPSVTSKCKALVCRHVKTKMYTLRRFLSLLILISNGPAKSKPVFEKALWSLKPIRWQACHYLRTNF
jgi:hypothetical protein